ncbi:MAG: hypothetical protein V1750_00295, partial [Acidobacteriota bacterium]
MVLALGCRRGPRRLWLIAVPVVAALAVDALVPARESQARVAARVAQAMGRLQTALATLAEAPEVRTVLAPGGGEAEPEAPFLALARLAALLAQRTDSLVLVDERGQAVAWTGPRPCLPVRLRALGERAVVAEPGLREAWLWWREPVLEGGRNLGGLLAGVAVAEAGERTLLGVWAGRAAKAAPRWRGGEEVRVASGGRVLGLEVLPAPAVWWSSPAEAALAAAVLLGLLLRGIWGGLLAAGALAILAGEGWLSWPWLLVTGLGALAWGIAALATAAAPARPRARDRLLGACCAYRRKRGSRWRRLARRPSETPAGVVETYVEDVSRRPTQPAGCQREPQPERMRNRLLEVGVRILAALTVAVLGWALAGLLGELGLRPVPEQLLLPGPLRLALVLALALLVRAGAGGRLPLPVRAASWAPLAAGLVWADPMLLGLGAGLVAGLGVRRGASLAPALVAAILLLGSDEAARRGAVVAAAESTLARLEREQGPARALLQNLPETALEGLVRLSPEERTVVLGRLADWL